MRRTLSLLLALTTAIFSLSCAQAKAEVLHGSVEQDTSSSMRIERPSAAGNGNSFQGQVQGQGTRINRIDRPTASLASSQPLIDNQAFSRPLSGNAQAQGLQGGLVKADSFTPPPNKNFDLGADENDRELVLAWERWYKQLSQEIYSRWNGTARVPGQATIKITVTRNHTLTAQVLNVDSRDEQEFLTTLMSAITSVNGDIGLTFPSGSKRQVVSYEADYLAGHHVTPGYTWIKNDYEKVHQSQ